MDLEKWVWAKQNSRNPLKNGRKNNITDISLPSSSILFKNINMLLIGQQKTESNYKNTKLNLL